MLVTLSQVVQQSTHFLKCYFAIPEIATTQEHHSATVHHVDILVSRVVLWMVAAVCVGWARHVFFPHLFQRAFCRIQVAAQVITLSNFEPSAVLLPVSA
jgi:hypothetical protein